MVMTLNLMIKEERSKEMRFINRVDANLPLALGPLALCDRFLALADEVDRAGFKVAGEHLLYLAMQIVDDPACLRG
jgi:hypothetical protein